MYSKPNVPYTQGMIVLFRSAVHVVAAAAIACTAVGAGPASPSDPIKIGVILPLTGSSAGVAQDLLRGIQLAFSENGNTVSGRKVEIVTADDQNTPATALTEARRLVENDKVSLLMGSLNSSVALTLLPSPGAGLETTMRCGCLGCWTILVRKMRYCSLGRHCPCSNGNSGEGAGRWNRSLRIAVSF